MPRLPILTAAALLGLTVTAHAQGEIDPDGANDADSEVVTESNVADNEVGTACALGQPECEATGDADDGTVDPDAVEPVAPLMRDGTDDGVDELFDSVQ
ncbi:hypothetical protein [Roseobacter sp. HKCCA0434]|uniref:hypothetical protein n=1 Tax=Roseobacter sp. HKCCA0434 TaxID=3079297 RepID=UPI002905AAC7|nr:hypothetical protein [Roseobacter sp. HKCCA0434]